MAETKEEKRAVFADPSRVKLAEYERQDWVVNAPEGVTVEDLENPMFWAHVAAQFRPYAHLEIRADDGTWLVQAIVLACERTWAKIKILQTYKLTTGDVSLTQHSIYEVKFRGPQHKWSVIRKADGSVIKSEVQTKDEVEAWLREHERTMLT